MSWIDNPIMEWWDARDGSGEWIKISDHGRTPLDISVERIETSSRMANGRLRRHTVSKKRTWSCNWENIPDKATNFLAGGQAGRWMEDFHNDMDGSFKMRLRSGSDQGKPTTDAGIEEVTVMITDYSRDVSKRGTAFDLWNISMSLEEV